MNKNEAVWLLGFLDELSDHHSNAGCNDVYLPDTPENRQLILAAQDHARQEDPAYEADGIHLYPSGYPNENKPKKIGTSDWIILSYLRKKFVQDNALEKEVVPDTQSW